MDSITVRELNQHTSRVLDDVTSTGKPVLVTFRGRPQWQIAPASAGDESPIERMIREGRATAPNDDLPLPLAPHRPKSGMSVDQLLAEMEEDR